MVIHHRRFRKYEESLPCCGKPAVQQHDLPGYWRIDHWQLHLAIEYDDIDVARWLIERGADVHAKAERDADDFSGHTPLIHTAVTLAAPDDLKARLLLERGAIPNARASIRKQLRHIATT